MFKTAITASPLIGEVQNEILGSISGDSFRSDVSMVSTLRCFFGSRIEDKQSINVYMRDFRCSDNDKSDPEAFVRGVISAVFPVSLSSSGTFMVCNLSSETKELEKASIEKARQGFMNVSLGYKENTVVSAFYHNSFPVACFYNEGLESVVLFVSSLNYRRLHFIQASLLSMFPWFRKGDKAAATELDVELIKSLTSDDEARYRGCLEKFADLYDFRAAKIKKELEGFEKVFEIEALEDVKEKIACADARINQLYENIRRELESRYDQCVIQLGLEAKIAQESDESELMEYFICNKFLTLDSVCGQELSFIVRANLEYFDPDSAETVINNRGGSVYRAGNGISKLLRAVLIDETLKIHLCAKFVLDMKRGVRAVSNVDYSQYGIADCVPNPHLNHHMCLGNNMSVINEMIRKRDYIGAINQCVAATKNWNVLDTIVTQEFVADIKNDYYTCIELPDGRIVKPSVAIKWLEEHKNEKKETEE